MTGIDRPPHGAAPMGPPWPVDVLADLHAGALDPGLAQALWPRVRQDRDARAVLDALDATRAELGGLAAVPPPMPARFATRLDAAIAAESAARTAAMPVPTPLVAPVVDLSQARRRRAGRIGWAAGALVAAAAIAVAVIVLPRGGTTVGTPSAAGGSTALRSGQLGGATLAAAIGRFDYGPFGEPARRDACLRANGVDPSRPPAGAMRVTLDGRPGVLFVLTTGQLARYRLLVVGPDCTAGNPNRLADTVIGGVPTPPTR